MRDLAMEMGKLLSRGRRRGLRVMNRMRKAVAKPQEPAGERRKPGRPPACRMTHEALHEALMGLAKA
jgi:hypothetical protein